MPRTIALLLVYVVSLVVVRAGACGAVVPNSRASTIESRAAPYPYVKAATRGRVYFKMLPGPSVKESEQVGVGRAYRVGIEEDELLWQTEGWYSWTTHIADTGRFLVRIEATMPSSGPSVDALGIAFYEEGELLRSHSTTEILKDRPLRSQEYFFAPQPFLDRDRPSGFIPEDSESAVGRMWFELFTADGYRTVFDVRTGELVRQSFVAELGK